MSKFNYLYEICGFDKNGEVKTVFVAVTLSYSHEEAFNMALDALWKESYTVRSVHCLKTHLVIHTREESEEEDFTAAVMWECSPEWTIAISAEKTRRELEESLNV